MSMQKTMSEILLCSTSRKDDSDTDLQDNAQPKKRIYRPKWLKEFQWLKFDSIQNRMQCKIFLDAYDRKANPFKNKDLFAICSLCVYNNNIALVGRGLPKCKKDSQCL